MKYAHAALVALAMALVISCNSHKHKNANEGTYRWEAPGELRTLTLLGNGTFLLDIEADYFSRKDSGRYEMHGDTLLLNPSQQSNYIDRLEPVDSLFEGGRFLEIYEEDISMEHNVVTDSFYRQSIFPKVFINQDPTALSVHPEDGSFRKLLLEDPVTVNHIRVELPIENTCQPMIPVGLEVPVPLQEAKSYRLYIRSWLRNENYLAGVKWLVKGDTIAMSFADEQCLPTQMKLARQPAP